MATNTLTGASISMQSRLPQLNQSLAFYSISDPRSAPISSHRKSNLSFGLRRHSSRLRVSCAAKQETLDKVCNIVKKQLALPDDSNVTGDSTFVALGADSLDTVEIVMGLEEEFGISVEEESAQKITTVQEVADLIDEITKNQVP